MLIKKITILDRYSNFADIFLKKKILVLLEQINFNEHIIKFKSDKQPSYRPIYSLGLVKLETLKIYIKTYLKIRFI